MAKHMSEPSPTPTPRQTPVAQGVRTRQISERTRSVREGGSSSARRGSGIGPIIFAVLAIAAIAAAVVFFVLPHFIQPSIDDGPQEQVSVVIPEGSGASAIANILVEAGVVDSYDEFMKEAARSGKDSQLKPGTYNMRTHSSPTVVLDLLVAGPNTSADIITIPEGRTVGQTAAIVDAEFGVDAEEFIRAASASAYVGDYPFLAEANEDSLEGFLYGKTYDLSGREHTADALIRAMLSQYQAEVASLDMNAAISVLSERYGVQMSAYDIVRMASIIEREAVTEEDRPLVSSVFYNRLAAGMYLQSDATMMYVTGGEVTAADLEQDSPYNTYKYPGFPPTPICSPSIESIRAAMEPADTGYYFFFIVEDGEHSVHAFSETYEEHLAVIDANRY